MGGKLLVFISNGCPRDIEGPLHHLLPAYGISPISKTPGSWIRKSRIEVEGLLAMPTGGRRWSSGNQESKEVYASLMKRSESGRLLVPDLLKQLYACHDPDPGIGDAYTLNACSK